MSRFGGAPKCKVCGKSVYMAEEVKANGESYHKVCFKCCQCNKSLDSNNMAVSEEKLYCAPCHRKIHDIHKIAYESTDSGVSTGGPDDCGRCGKAVYTAEKIVGAGKNWHKRCFYCQSCHKSLDSTSVCDNEGEIYCKGCYGGKFGPKGYGYGGGAGALTRTE